MTRSRSIAVVLGTLLAIVAGAVLWHRLPANTDTFAPFDVRGAAGEHLTGRGLSGTADGVTITPLLVNRFGKQLTPVGTWVVVDALIDGGDDPAAVRADLLVGPNTYLPSDRIPNAASVQPGIADRRDWVFDVAPDALAAASTVVFRMWVGDGRLDSRLVVGIALDGPRAHRTPALRLPPPRLAAS